MNRDKLVAPPSRRPAAPQAAFAAPPNRQGLAWRWTLRLVQRLSEAAPGPAEALLGEHLRLMMGRSESRGWCRASRIRHCLCWEGRLRPAPGSSGWLCCVVCTTSCWWWSLGHSFYVCLRFGRIVSEGPLYVAYVVELVCLCLRTIWRPRPSRGPAGQE